MTDELAYLDGAKGEMLRLLLRRREALGLTEPVIRMMVNASEISYPSSRFPLLTGSQTTGHVRFLIKGVLKIVCRVPRFGDLVVDLVGHGEFVHLPPVARHESSCRLEVIVHEGPAVLALVPLVAVLNGIGALPATHVARLLSATWRRASRLLYLKLAMLRLPTDERLKRELVRLARRFGCPRDDGWTLVSVRLLQSDLAALIGRSRANASRAFAKLSEVGAVDRVGSRILVARRLLESSDSRPSVRPSPRVSGAIASTRAGSVTSLASRAHPSRSALLTPDG